jgi:predicted nuclease of restriction endonuclease-like (RecB) superfamily
MGKKLLPIEGYEDFLQDLKERIRHSRTQAVLSVNRELVLLYWQIGRDILNRQQQFGWGAKVIDRLATDLRQTFPDMKGFSTRNLKYMRQFAEAYPEVQFVQEVLAQITWYHNITLIEKVKPSTERLWYAQQTIQNGWSRNVLVHQIESDLFHRQGKAITNFKQTLSKSQSELAVQLLKDPYTFDFLSLEEKARERDLEKALIKHLRDFLLELGIGFAFVGSQYHIEIDEQDFYIDLLFYHLQLRCFIVIDLKTTDFKPEYSGKMNFYLAAVDDLLKNPHDQPSLGIILCKSKAKTIVEYALRDLKRPIGVSTYQLTKVLPEQLQENLPTIEQLEAELNTVSCFNNSK